MNLQEMLAALAEVRCADYHFQIQTTGHGQLYLQAEYVEQDVYSGDPAVQKTRKWMLSEHMTKSEFVQTCFKAVMTSYEHRARESFLFRGRRVFGPHIDIEALWSNCETTEVRPPPPEKKDDVPF
jgi:hypothetical protein